MCHKIFFYKIFQNEFRIVDDIVIQIIMLSILKKVISS